MNYCAVCPRNYEPVPGDGPTPAQILIIGERPGRNENYRRKNFIGESGKELNENYLRLAGLERDECRVINTVRCFAQNNKTPTDAEVEGCSQHFIPDEIEATKPEVVMLLGATACKLIGGVDLDAEHGVPRKGSIFGYECWIVPHWHPAAALHDTTMMTDLLDDWEKLKPWLRSGYEKWQWAVDKFETRDYRLVRSVNEVDLYFARCGFRFETKRPVIAGGDSESHAGAPWSIQVSVKEGTGIMVRLDGLHSTMTCAISAWLENSRMVFHNAEADLELFESLFRRKIDYRDTMQEAYQFQNLPQGLKALARRLLGRIRPGWKEVVGPPSRQALSSWLYDAIEKLEPTIEKRVSEKTGKPLKDKVIKHPDHTDLNRILKHTLISDEYDPWKRLKLMERLDQASIPQLGIANVDLSDAIHYGCSDADDCLTLALMFDRMRDEFHQSLNLQDEDIDR